MHATPLLEPRSETPESQVAALGGGQLPARDEAGSAHSPLRMYALVTVLNLTAWGVVTWQLRSPTRGAFRIELPPTPSFPATVAPVGTPTEVRLVLHVAGSVRDPGLVRLAEGARVADAIAAAGGFAEDADKVRVNLASPVMDGVLLVVPSVGAPTREAPPGGAEMDQDGPLNVQGFQSGSGVESLGQVPPPAVSSGSSTGQTLNINTATAADLEALPGIGPALAARIVAHRESNGPFRAIDDLLAVSGIGQAVLNKIAELVRVE